MSAGNEYGLQCPQCGQDDSFAITASHVIDLADGNVDAQSDDLLMWGAQDKIVCGVCKHEGTVQQFEGA